MVFVCHTEPLKAIDGVPILLGPFLPKARIANTLPSMVTSSSESVEKACSVTDEGWEDHLNRAAVIRLKVIAVIFQEIWSVAFSIFYYARSPTHEVKDLALAHPQVCDPHSKSWTLS